ncbi:MAG: hypothetical protein V3U57_08845, partial [Robiginitomaculum sp.]
MVSSLRFPNETLKKIQSAQAEFFITNADFNHPALRGLDAAEAVLDWHKLEHLMSGIYASK